MQDISNRPGHAELVGVVGKALTLGEAVQKLRMELGFAQEMGAREVVNAAWQELDWAERGGSLKEQVGEVCSEMGIVTGWASAATAAAAAADVPNPTAPACDQTVVVGTPERVQPAQHEPGIEACAATPEHVVKQRERRRLMFLETEAGVVGSAEKFVGRSLSDVVQARIDARDDKVEVEEIEDDDGDGDEDDEEDVVQMNARSKMSRAERKSRKAMSKLGMQPVVGITRATIKKPGGILFAVSNPDVYCCSEGSYVMFGEALVEDMAANAAAGVTNVDDAPSSTVEKATAAEAEADDEDTVDETGLASCDIELVMAQTGGSRARAARALKQASGDVVSAIMALTM